MRLSKLADILFPVFCPLCGSGLPGSGIPEELVCPSCRRLLPRSDGPFCRSCGKPLISEMELCLRCRDEEFEFDRGFSLYFYRDAARELIYQYKMGNSRYLSSYFAWEFQQRYFQGNRLVPLIPVPSLAGNLKKRGWDPVYAVVSELGRLYGHPIRTLLKRLPSASQKSLGLEARKMNMTGKIRIIGRKKVPGEVILIDDVWTTGSTVRECSRILKKYGAEKVSVITIVRD